MFDKKKPLKQSLFFVILLNSFLLFSFNGNPEVVCRAPTKEEAFSYLIRIIKKLPWFKVMYADMIENGYKISLPSHKVFESIYSNPYQLTEEDERYLKKVFCDEIYDITEFDDALISVRIVTPFVKTRK